MTENTNHIVSSYDALLKRISNEISDLFQLVSSQLSKTKTAILEHDIEESKKIIDDDKFVNLLDGSIHDSCMLLLIKQPVASDLRHAIVGMSISSDLERIGDNIRNIARVIESIAKTSEAVEGDIIEMVDFALEMLNKIQVAFKEINVEKANECAVLDDKIDDAYSRLSKEIIQIIKLDPENSESYSNYFFAGRYIERIGDHVNNIAESINFLATGQRHTYG